MFLPQLQRLDSVIMDVGFSCKIIYIREPFWYMISA